MKERSRPHFLEPWPRLIGIIRPLSLQSKIIFNKWILIWRCHPTSQVKMKTIVHPTSWTTVANSRKSNCLTHQAKKSSKMWSPSSFPRTMSNQAVKSFRVHMNIADLRQTIQSLRHSIRTTWVRKRSVIRCWNESRVVYLIKVPSRDWLESRACLPSKITRKITSAVSARFRIKISALMNKATWKTNEAATPVWERTPRLRTSLTRTFTLLRRIIRLR